MSASYVDRDAPRNLWESTHPVWEAPDREHSVIRQLFTFRRLRETVEALSDTDRIDSEWGEPDRPVFGRHLRETVDALRR
jgi:hypothetical protein